MKSFGSAVFCFVILGMFSCTSNKKVDLGDPELNPSTIDKPVNTKALGTPDFGKDTVFHFGRVTEGEKVTHTFTFKNTGTGNLLISNVDPSCGCTTPNWTKEVIPPGEEGSVKVLFDSNGRGGPAGIKSEKHVTVNFSGSTVPVLVLKFTATVFGGENNADNTMGGEHK